MTGFGNLLMTPNNRAIADYSKAIRLDANDARAYYGRGLAYGGLKQFDRAIADFGKVIRVDPNNAGAYNIRGTTCLMLDKVKKGCADLIKACKLGECGTYETARQSNICK